jgi:hypothetical protein
VREVKEELRRRTPVREATTYDRYLRIAAAAEFLIELDSVG